MTTPDSIAAALPNHAEGRHCLAAAAELLIAQDWLDRDASLADGIPVDLRDTLTGLDDRNIQLLTTAIHRASGKISRPANIDDHL